MIPAFTRFQGWIVVGLLAFIAVHFLAFDIFISYTLDSLFGSNNAKTIEPITDPSCQPWDPEFVTDAC